MDEILLVVTAQPRCTARLDQIPNQIHRCRDGLTTVDHIPAEHQMVVRRQNRKQIEQRLVAAVHISNHPVLTSALVQDKAMDISQFCLPHGPQQLSKKQIRTIRESACVPAVLPSLAWIFLGLLVDNGAWYHRR